MNVYPTPKHAKSRTLPRLLRLLAIGALIIFLVLATTSTATLGQGNEVPVIVRLSKAAYEQVADIQTIYTIDYDSFVWLELTPSNFEELRTRGVTFEQQPDPTILRFQAYRIDTRLDQPLFKVYLPLVFNGGGKPPAATQQTGGIAAGSPSLYIIQLLGPAKDKWLADLEVNGLELLQYYTPYAYLVRMTPDKVAMSRGFDFVRWIGPYLPAYKIPSDLLARTGTIENVSIMIYDDGLVDGTADGGIEAIKALGGALVEQETRARDPFVNAIFSLPASALTPVAQLNDVVWLNYHPPVDELEDEMSNQIIAGNFGPLGAGYQAWLTSKGVNGAGVTVALIDTGYDTGNNATAHPDVQGRLIPVGTVTDGNGHGTHVGGIMAGNASLATTDASGFLMGLGVAPNVNLVARRNTGADANRTRDSVTNGAVASNNSYALHNASIGYTNRDRTYDLLVRDADQNTTTVAEPLIIVFSAGNCGNGPAGGTCNGNTGPTKEAKNIIAVGSTQNQRDGFGNPGSGNINNVVGSSSRGPTGDGRIYPHLAAPGGNIISTRSSQAPSTCATIATGAPAANPTYSMCSGTSMAAPHVTGAAALITEWWRGFNAGADPSPAMAKALLVNGAVDMGTANIPNGSEGWGRINLDNVIDSGIPTVYLDQTTIFGATGETWFARYVPADPSQPVKVTLAWTDAPGPGGGGNPITLVNDLDLTVDEASTLYRGNVFANGFSTPGGSADQIDNLENVFIQNPLNAVFSVTVQAAGINGDGLPYNGDNTDQDFALVIQNAIEAPTADADGPYTTDEGIDVALDGSGSSDSSGSLTYAWDFNYDGVTFDTDATGPTPTFDLVGQDGVFLIALRVTNPSGGFDLDTTTVTVNNVAPSLVLASDAPQDEGSPVTVSGVAADPGWLDSLTATIDWDDGSAVEPIVGAQENIRPDATLTFEAMHIYGDNGAYNVEVCVSDDDTTTCQIIALQIDNVPPEVQIDPGQLTAINEGDLVNVLANFSDPGWLDTYTSLIDWGSGASEAGALVVTVEGPPADQGQVTGSHQYGDNGLFAITITVADDDGGAGSDSFDLTVNNIDPTAEIDETGTTLVNGTPTFLAHAGEPLDFSGRSQDPGSDDLTLSWDWDDGPPAPDAATTYLVNPPNPDPFPSPSVQPRDVTDTQSHAFADACLYEISFLADDDDGGQGHDQAKVIITGNADQARSSGYWQHQYHGVGNIDFDQATLECYLAIVDYVSLVFNEERDASTIELAYDVLFMQQNEGSASEQFDRELLTTWLNFANGAIEYDELLDTDGDDIAETSFADVVAVAEAVRLDANASEAEIREQKNILHHIKPMAD